MLKKFDAPIGMIYAWVLAKKDYKDETFVGTGQLRKKSAEERVNISA